MEPSTLKKLFLRLGVLLIAVWLPILLLNGAYVRTEHFRTENGVADYVDVPMDLDLVNTGSSHGKYAFRYDGLADVTGFNLAMEAQPFLYDFAMLKEFSNHLHPGSIVLLSVSSESFHRHSGTTPQIRPRYYRILSRRNHPEYHVGEALRHSLLPVLGAGRNIKAIWYDSTCGNDAFLYASLGSSTPDALLQLARIRHKDREVVVIAQSNDKIQEDNMKLLESMVNACWASNWVPVLVNLPFIRALNELDDASFRSAFNRRLEEVRSVSGNPLLLDYSNDPRFVDSPELFADADHLNAKGAALLTAQVVADLRERHLLPSHPHD